MRSDGTASTIIDAVAWLAVAVLGGLTIVQALGWDLHPTIATLQALTPYLALLLVPVAVWALWRRRHDLTAVAGAIGFGLLVLATPVVTGRAQPQVAAGTEPLRVASVNLLYENARVAEVADHLRSVDADVIVFNEYTAEHQATLRATALADEYPHRVERPAPLAGGIALWSRRPTTATDPPATFHPSLDVRLDTPDGVVRLVAVHPPTPLFDFDAWRDDLDLIEQLGHSTDLPTAVVGDFNASYWHPAFRDLLDAGFVDAHIATGRGFSTSWPTGGLVPPFVQLDRALTVGPIAPLDLEQFDVPGSDHRGFVVTLARTPRQ